MLSTTMASSNDSIKMARLDQELRQTMTMLTRDLRRATIWDPAVDVVRVSLADPLKLSGNSGSVTVTSSAGNLDDIGARAVGGTLIYKTSEKNVTTGEYEVHVYKGLITAYGGGSYTVTLAGTWPATVLTDLDPDGNGVSAATWSIQRPESALTVSGTCILFAADDPDQDPPSASVYYDNSERFGYRYDATDKAVEVRTSGTSANTCTSGGSWENLTDEDTVAITGFSVDDKSPDTLTSSGLSVEIREFTISITGNLKSDPSVERTLQETVRVRNDRVS